MHWRGSYCLWVEGYVKLNINVEGLSVFVSKLGATSHQYRDFRIQRPKFEQTTEQRCWFPVLVSCVRGLFLPFFPCGWYENNCVYKCLINHTWYYKHTEHIHRSSHLSIRLPWIGFHPRLLFLDELCRWSGTFIQIALGFNTSFSTICLPRLFSISSSFPPFSADLRH